MSDSNPAPDPRDVPRAPKLPQIDSPPPEDVLESVPSPQEIIEEAQSVEEIVKQQPSPEDLPGNDR